MIGTNTSPNAPDQLPGRLQRLHATKRENAGPVNCIRWLGDRQEVVYLPLGFFGLTVMSYFGNVTERSKRSL
jgi:hypothetical protein